MRSVLIVIAAVAAGWAAGGSLLQQAPPSSAHTRNPMEGKQTAVRAGAKLYGRECAACHGSRREGIGKAPPLDRPDVAHAPAGALFWVLRNGSLHHGMPSFAHLPEAERWQIVTFLKTAAAFPSANLSGNARSHRGR